MVLDRSAVGSEYFVGLLAYLVHTHTLQYRYVRGECGLRVGG